MWISAGAFIAASYNYLAFLLVGHMGAVGAMVMGNLKTPSIIVSSVIIFGNPCTLLQAAGFAWAVFGGYMYNKYGSEVSFIFAKAF